MASASGRINFPEWDKFIAPMPYPAHNYPIWDIYEILVHPYR